MKFLRPSTKDSNTTSVDTRMSQNEVFKELLCLETNNLSDFRVNVKTFAIFVQSKSLESDAP